MRRAVLVSLIVIVVLGVGTVAALSLTGDDGPSAQEREACASVQDFWDDLGSRSDMSHLRRAGRAANRSDNTALAEEIRSLRNWIGQASEEGDFESGLALEAIEAECDSLGVQVDL